MNILNFESSFPLIKKEQKINKFITPKISFRVNPGNNMNNHKGTKKIVNTSNVFDINRLGLSNTFEAGKSLTFGVDYKFDLLEVNPTKKTIIQYYLPDLKENIVKGILTSPYNTLGGIIKISSFNINKVNGFPNDIWGWGCEDKALQNRTEYYNIIKETNILHNNKIRDDEYFKTFDDINDRDTTNYNKYYRKYYNKKINNDFSSGLNNIDYNIIERHDINDNVELIKVDI